jgi:hypothetical protein
MWGSAWETGVMVKPIVLRPEGPVGVRVWGGF